VDPRFTDITDIVLNDSGDGLTVKLYATFCRIDHDQRLVSISDESLSLVEVSHTEMIQQLDGIMDGIYQAVWFFESNSDYIIIHNGRFYAYIPNYDEENTGVYFIDRFCYGMDLGDVVDYLLL